MATIKSYSDLQQSKKLVISVPQSKHGAIGMDVIKTIKRMKSIKEKADEYAKEQNLRMAYNGSCDNCRQGFEEGANYVLEKFVDIVNKNTKPNGMEDRAAMASDMLILITQLKK